MRFIESLEDRRLMSGVKYLGYGVFASAGVTVTAGDYYLDIQGTSKADRIIVKAVDNERHPQPIVSDLRIRINAGAGNDFITIIGNDNRGGKGGAVIYGEAGNDRISGGTGGDYIDGGDGNDIITANNAILIGGFGSDRMSGNDSTFLSGQFINTDDANGNNIEYNLDRLVDRDVIIGTGAFCKIAYGTKDRVKGTFTAAWVSTVMQ